MGINLGAISPISIDQTSTGGAQSSKIQNNVDIKNLVQQVPNSGGGITLNLSKGLSLDLSKSSPFMKKIKIGLGWDSTNGKPIDLDVFALTLHDGKIKSNRDVIYYNQQDFGTGVSLSGDNLTGEGDGDDETLIVDTTLLEEGITSIAIFVNAYKPGVNFGMIEHVYVRLVDAITDKEECIYILNEEAGMNNAFHFANIKVSNQKDLTFETVGQATTGNIQQISTRFM